MVTRRRPERLAFRVTPAGLEIADTFSAARFKAKGLNAGDLVFAEIRKPRNPGYHRLAHALGQIVADNIDEFEGMDSHAAHTKIHQHVKAQRNTARNTRRIARCSGQNEYSAPAGLRTQNRCLCRCNSDVR